MASLWEYHVYWWSRRDTWEGKADGPGIKAMLSAMGAAAWELVSVTETPQTGYTFFFKRPMHGAAPEQPAPDAVRESEH